MTKPAVTRNDFADHLRVSSAVKTYKCSEWSKVYEVLGLQKSQTGGKLHECGRCGKVLILYSDLTDPQVINVNWNLMHVVHVVSLLEGVQFFTKHEKIPTGKNPYIQSTINPSSGRNHMSVARISVMGNHSLHQENSLFLQVPFRPKDIRWCILKRPSKCYQCGQAFCLHLKLLENIHTR